MYLVVHWSTDILQLGVTILPFFPGRSLWMFVTTLNFRTLFTIHHPPGGSQQDFSKNANLIPLFLKPYTSVFSDWNLAISAQLASLMWMGPTHITNLLPTLHVPTHAPWQSTLNPAPLQPTNKEKLFSLPKNTPPSPSPGPCSSLLPGDCRCPHLPVDTVLGTDETHRNQVQMCPLLQGSQQVYKRPALILLVKLSAQDTRNATVTVGYTAEGPATKHRSF